MNSSEVDSDDTDESSQGYRCSYASGSCRNDPGYGEGDGPDDPDFCVGKFGVGVDPEGGSGGNRPQDVIYNLGHSSNHTGKILKLAVCADKFLWSSLPNVDGDYRNIAEI